MRDDTTQLAADESCVNWGKMLLRQEGFSDWNIDFSPGDTAEGITIWKNKTIYIHWRSGEPDYSLMAHEIAHVCTGRGGHDSEFAHQFMRLVRLYFNADDPALWTTCSACGYERWINKCHVCHGEKQGRF